MAKRSVISARVTLDSKELTVPGDVQSVQDLMIWVQSRVLAPSLVLDDVLLDGNRLSEEDERRSHELPLARYGQVELVSRKTIDIAVDGLSSARDVLPVLLADAKSAAAFFRHGDVENALRALEDVMSMIDWYLGLVGAIDTVLVVDKPWLKHRGPENAPARAGGEFRTFSPPEELREKFALFKSAQQEQEPVLLARLLEREIIPLIESWTEEIPEILAKMKAERHEA